jgi:NAD(P)-dependent dehydrogenase (short-subunit alcohol dehydrogenase family)
MRTMQKEKNMNVIITGGAQGIGKGTAKYLLEKGCSVMVSDIDAEAGRGMVDEYKNLGRIEFLKGDNGKEQDIKKLVATAVKRFGSIDGLVNNAGIGINKPVTELTLKEWNRVIAVNLTGAMLAAKYTAPHLIKSKGAIVNIASTRAFMSEANTESYSASKGGIIALTHSLAVSFSSKIRVNSISPGWIEVGDWKKKSIKVEPKHSEADKLQHPAGRVGVPEDIAAMVYFLISKESGFITGQNYIIDGGMTRKMIYV